MWRSVQGVIKRIARHFVCDCLLFNKPLLRVEFRRKKAEKKARKGKKARKIKKQKALGKTRKGRERARAREQMT